MKNLREELNELESQLGLTSISMCTDEEEKMIKELEKNKQPLPEGIRDSMSGTHYRNIKSDLQEDEIKRLLLFRQTKYLKTLKNSAIFFTALTIINMICSVIILTNLGNILY